MDGRFKVKRLKIEEFCHARGKTMASVANKLDVSWEQVYNYNSGRSFPKLQRLVNLAKALGCTLDELIEVKDEL